jgi:hypothetical protein
MRTSFADMSYFFCLYFEKMRSFGGFGDLGIGYRGLWIVD